MRTGLARRIGRPGVGFTVALVTLAMLSAVAGVSRAQAGESPGGTPPSGSETSVLVAGVGEVPADAEGVFLNVTAVDARSSGFLTLYPCGRTRPSTSNVNYGQRGPLPRDWDNLMIDPGNDDYYGNGASGCTDISDSPLLGIY